MQDQDHNLVQIWQEFQHFLSMFELEATTLSLPCSFWIKTEPTPRFLLQIHLPPQLCHIPAFLAPTATAFVLFHCTAQLCHNCTPSSHKFSAVDSKSGELPHLPMPSLANSLQCHICWAAGAAALQSVQTMSHAWPSPAGRSMRAALWHCGLSVLTILMPAAALWHNQAATIIHLHPETKGTLQKLILSLGTMQWRLPVRASGWEWTVCSRLLPLATAFAWAHHPTSLRHFVNDSREGTSAGHEPSVLTLWQKMNKKSSFWQACEFTPNPSWQSFL